jgi:hypothetical protein
MPIKLSIRTQAGVSPFRKYLAELITLPTGPTTDQGIVIASPFWHTSIIDKQPPATLAELLRTHCRWIWTLADARYDNLNAYPEYRGFLRALYHHTRAGFFPTLMYRLSSAPRGHYWHAKIALRVVDHEVVAAIIGSSNMTSSAYFAPPMSKSGKWNLEGDVILWRDRPHLNAHFLGSEPDPDAFEVVAQEISAGSIGSITGGMTVPERRSIDSQLDWIAQMVRSHHRAPSWSI